MEGKDSYERRTGVETLQLPPWLVDLMDAFNPPAGRADEDCPESTVQALTPDELPAAEALMGYYNR